MQAIGPTTLMLGNSKFTATLPKGLSINPQTGVITGKPTETTEQIIYEINCTDERTIKNYLSIEVKGI